MPTISRVELLRQIPAVDEILRSAKLAEVLEREGHAATSFAVRTVLDRIRAEINGGGLDAPRVRLAVDGIPEAVDRELRRTMGFSLRRVINATGVILHTNLGRAPISSAALEHLREISAGYSNLEFDLESGERGRRDVHVQRLFDRLFANHFSGNPASRATPPHAIVVNNCAAAVLLALNTVAEGGEVIVSRGELVEIGGSFRVPEIMAKSGGRLREVGTTNRTRLSDYEEAINAGTRLLLRVHRSNFAMVGFTERPSVQQLVELGRRRGIPVMEDLGNGLLVDLAGAGIQNEEGLLDSLAAGVDVVCASGDKLLGGPQAGLIAGGKELITRMRANPLFRAFRPDKLTYAALEATLLAYVRQDYSSIPTLRMIFTPAEEIRERAEKFIALAAQASLRLELVATESIIGGGTAPDKTLPSYAVAVESDALSAEEIQTRLRKQSPPVIARVEQERLLLDMRTVGADEEAALMTALRNSVRPSEA